MLLYLSIRQVSKYVEHKIVIIFLPIICNIYVFGALKNRLIETVLLSTDNICFDRKIRSV